MGSATGVPAPIPPLLLSPALTFGRHVHRGAAARFAPGNARVGHTQRAIRLQGGGGGRVGRRGGSIAVRLPHRARQAARRRAPTRAAARRQSSSLSNHHARAARQADARELEGHGGGVGGALEE